MFRYKIKPMEALKAAGYTSYMLAQKENNLPYFGQATLQKFRKLEKMPSWEELGKLCKLLKCQPWDIIEYVPEDAPAE